VSAVTVQVDLNVTDVNALVLNLPHAFRLHACEQGQEASCVSNSTLTYENGTEIPHNASVAGNNVTYHLAQSMSHEGFVNVRTNGIRLPNECGDASYSVTAKFCTAMGSAIVCEDRGTYAKTYSNTDIEGTAQGCNVCNACAFLYELDGRSHFTCTHDGFRFPRSTLDGTCPL
jgi:hypothetical protein